MHKNLIMGYLFLFLLLLGACTAEPMASEEPSSEKIAYDMTSIVQLSTHSSILADGILYDITRESQFSKTSGAAIGRDDLNPGDLVFISPEGQNSGTEASRPLVSLTVLDDEKSLKVSRAVGHLMENQEIGKIISPEIKSVNHQLVTVQFKDSTNGQLYESIVNLNTLSFHVQPIGQPQ